jgi:hypothetical protein
VAKTTQEVINEAFRADRPIFVGPKISGGKNLEQPGSIHTCKQCGKLIWIKEQDWHAWRNEEGKRPVYICADCYAALGLD